MTYREALPWVGAAVIAAHNLEEAVTGPSWLRQHSPGLVLPFGRSLPHVSNHALYTALVTVTLLSVVWIAAAFRSSSRSLRVYSLVSLFGIYFANAFVPHIVGAVILNSYVPGVLTASLAVVPYTVLFIWAGVRGGWYTMRGIGIALTVALALYLLFATAGQLLLLSGYASA